MQVLVGKSAHYDSFSFLYACGTRQQMNMNDQSSSDSIGFLETVAAIVIQTAYRRHQAVLHVASLKKGPIATFSRLREQRQELLQYRAAVGLGGTKNKNIPKQASRHAHVGGPEDMYELAAIRIQSAFRGFWARDSLDVDHYCATIIQTAFRSYCCRQQFRETYIRVVSRVVCIQAIWRRSRARDHAATLLGAAILIQALARGYIIRSNRSGSRGVRGRTSWQQGMVANAVRAKEMGELGTLGNDDSRSGKSIASDVSSYSTRLTRRSLKHASRRAAQNRGSRIVNQQYIAATRIQSAYRRHAAENAFIHSLVDVLIVQTVVRRWMSIREGNRL